MSTDTASQLPNMCDTLRTIKPNKKFIADVKNDIDSAIEFLNSMHTSDSMMVDRNIKNMTATGYTHMFTINAKLEIYSVTEENQSNKILCEEAKENMIPMNGFLGTLHDITRNYTVSENNMIYNVAKIRSKTEETDVITSMIQQHDKSNHVENKIKIDRFNHLINLGVLSLIKTREILKKI